MIPVALISGYLGSGKTTLLLKIIEKVRKRVAILINEFGEINIDAKILEGKNIKYSEISGGCVCCSLTGELELALKEIAERFEPELIIIETTGIAEPDAIIINLENLEDFKIDSVITVVDCYSMVKFPSLGQTGRIQIEMADVLILNKIDLVSERELEEVERKVRSINERALILKAKYCDVDIDLLFGLWIEKHFEVHSHQIEVESFLYESDFVFDKEKFENFTNSLPPEIYRAKGFVKFEDSYYLFNFVAGRYDLEKWKDVGKSKIVFIGKDILKLKEEISFKLNECRLIK